MSTILRPRAAQAMNMAVDEFQRATQVGHPIVGCARPFRGTMNEGPHFGEAIWRTAYSISFGS